MATDDVKTRRLLTFWTLVFGWAAFYGLRLLIFSNIGFMQEDWGYTKEQIGTIVSSFSITYGLGKFLFGNLVDKVNPKLLFLYGLLGSGLLSLVFPLVRHWLFSAVIAFLFGLTASSGWPSAGKMLFLWYEPEEKGSKYAMVSLSGNVAGAVIPLLVSQVTLWGYPWWSSFFGLASISILIAILGFRTLSLPEKPPQEKSSLEQKRITPKSSSYCSNILCNTTLWCLCLFILLLNFVRYTVINWSQLHIKEYTSISMESATFGMTWYHLGAVVGSYLCGITTDWFIKKNLYFTNSPRISGLAVFVAAYCCFFLLYVNTIHSQTSMVWIFSILFILGFLGEGASTPMGLASMETVDKSSSGSAHAFFSLFSQSGTFVSGYPMSWCLEKFGWDMSLKVTAVLPFLSLVLLYMSALFQPPIRRGIKHQ